MLRSEDIVMSTLVCSTVFWSALNDFWSYSSSSLKSRAALTGGSFSISEGSRSDGPCSDGGQHSSTSFDASALLDLRVP